MERAFRYEDVPKNPISVDNIPNKKSSSSIKIETTEYKEENFPASPLPAMLVLPRLPVIIWSTTLNDDCNTDCKVTGSAILHTVEKNDSFCKYFSFCFTFVSTSITFQILVFV